MWAARLPGLAFSRNANQPGRTCTPSGEGHVVLWAWGRVEEVWSSANSLPILFTISVIFCFCLFCVSKIFVFMFSTSRRRVGTLNLKWQMLAHPIYRTKHCTLLNGKWSINHSAHFLHIVGKIALNKGKIQILSLWFLLSSGLAGFVAFFQVVLFLTLQ